MTVDLGAVVADLERQRADLDVAIAALRPLLNGHVSAAAVAPQGAPPKAAVTTATATSGVCSPASGGNFTNHLWKGGTTCTRCNALKDGPPKTAPIIATRPPEHPAPVQSIRYCAVPGCHETVGVNGRCDAGHTGNYARAG